jgi:hypothetical protein
LPFDTRFAGSIPTKVEGFLRAIKIRGRTSFGGEVKPSVLYRNILREVKEPYENEGDSA